MFYKTYLGWKNVSLVVLIKFCVFLQTFDFPLNFLINEPYDIPFILKNSFFGKILKISTERVKESTLFRPGMGEGRLLFKIWVFVTFPQFIYSIFGEKIVRGLGSRADLSTLGPAKINNVFLVSTELKQRNTLQSNQKNT